jgi:hypothetical protein
MDTNKLQQAKQIIINQVGKIPANVPADHGTVGAWAKHTKRESEAHDMARYIISKLAGIKWSAEIEDSKRTAEELAALAMVKQLEEEVISITGK